MIVDRLENYGRYFSSKEARLAFDYLLGLGPDAAEGDFPIRGEEIYARVMSYDTRTVDVAKLEGHRRYIDIQTTLVGVEGIDWVPLRGLEPRMAYDERKDVQFFARPDLALCRVNVFPGTFALFLPDDVHMPQLMVGPLPAHIKKAVIKIQVELLFPGLRRE